MREEVEIRVGEVCKAAFRELVLEEKCELLVLLYELAEFTEGDFEGFYRMVKYGAITGEHAVLEHWFFSLDSNAAEKILYEVVKEVYEQVYPSVIN